MGFGSNMKKHAARITESVGESVMDVVEKFQITVVDYSPTKFIGAKYAQGVFVNSWYPAVNEFDPTVGGAADMSGSGSRQRILAMRATKPFSQGDAFISLSNSLDYAYRVEHLGWTITPAYAPIRNSITFLSGVYKT